MLAKQDWSSFTNQMGSSMWKWPQIRQAPPMAECASCEQPFEIKQSETRALESWFLDSSCYIISRIKTALWLSVSVISLLICTPEYVYYVTIYGCKTTLGCKMVLAVQDCKHLHIARGLPTHVNNICSSCTEVGGRTRNGLFRVWCKAFRLPFFHSSFLIFNKL